MTSGKSSQPPPTQLLGASLGSLLLGEIISPGNPNGLLNRSVLTLLFMTGCVPHPICRTSPQGTVWPDPSVCITRNDFFMP